ncbi:MAG: methylated-DNA--[protein]-cysteine S-methyltransferase [Microcystaceae cyanobacterium]
MGKFYSEPTEIGLITIVENEGKITQVCFATDSIPPNLEMINTSLLAEAFAQLRAYLAGELLIFSLPLSPSGTDFQQQVWQHLTQITYGETLSYKDLAIALHNPQAGRAVGQANNRNPIPLFIPCHRVIGANGKLIGYRGGLTVKTQLLATEKRVSNKQVG